MMIRKILYFIVTVGALAWIGIAGFELLNFSENSDPEKIFGEEDGRIFILNRPSEIQVSNTDFYIQPTIEELYGLLINTMAKKERLYVSEKKGHILLETTQLISEEEIRKRFGSNLKKTGNKSYEWKEFNLELSKGILDCRIRTELKSKNEVKWSSFDEKSSCSIISFENREPIVQDFYQKEDMTHIFTRRSHKSNETGYNDEELFSNFIPSNITSYDFTTKETLANIDPVFKMNPAYQWTASGCVTFEMDGARFLVTDCIEGGGAEEILQEYQKNKNNQYAGVLLLENFPFEKKKSIYFKKISNLCVFSTSELGLSQYEVTIELRQTLASNPSKRNQIFAETPKSVNRRSWSPTKKTAESFYGNSLISVEIIASKKFIPNISVEPTIKNYTLQSSVSDFIVHPQIDLVIAVSKEHELAGFKNGKNSFKSEKKSAIVGSLFWSNLTTDISGTVGFTTANQFHLLNEDGTPLPGFPVRVEGEIIHGAIPFIYNQSENYLVVTSNQKYHWINSTGKIVRSANTEVSQSTGLPHVWTSQNRLFFGFQGNGSFAMIEAEKNKKLRSFPVSDDAVAVELKNQIYFYHLENNILYKTDQKGDRTKLDNISKGIWIRPIAKYENSGFFVKDGNEIRAYDDVGSLYFKTKVPIESIDFLTISKTARKGVLLAVVDGLTNKIHLFQNNGIELPLPKNEAQSKVQFSNVNRAITLTTVLDKFIIKYVL